MSNPTNKPNVMICMVRGHLRNVPQFELPEGFSFRPYRPGDAGVWVWIHELADWLGKRTVETFNEQFGHDLPAMEDRCLFLVAPDGRTVGTTTAWYENDFCGRSWGRIHWVAIIPEFQGRGLAKPMMTAAMNRLASSHDNAYLFTHTLRVPAVNLYLNFGFRPLVRSDAERAGWQDLRGQLKPHPLMQEPWLTPETLYDGTD